MESTFGKELALGRDAKMFLSYKYTSENLKDIGAYFGIGESVVSQSNRRVNEKLKSDKKLRRKIRKIENKLKL